MLWVVVWIAGAVACDDARTRDAPPVLGTVPAFELVDQTGERFTADALDGQYWVADFIFTRCADVCPMLSRTMVDLQKRLGAEPATADVRLVSYSVDPQHDTPEVLSQYAERFGADTAHWTFATGTREAIWKLSKDGFKLAVGGEPENTAAPLFHTDRFVLVDPQGRIRGYYSALEPAGIESLMGDLGKLMRAP